MFRSILLFTTCIAASILFFSKTNFTDKRHKGFSIGEPTDFDRLSKMQEQLMLADPATGKIPADIRNRELQFYKDYIAPNNKQTRATEDWYSAGPWNVGGRTRAAAIDVTNSNNIIGGSVSGGIWRTTDGGQTWKNTSNLAGYLGVTSISQDTRPGKQNIWYACTGEGSGNSASGGGSYYFGDGVFKSLDSGASWQPLANTATGKPNTFSQPYQISWRIVTHPSTDSDYVFLATYGCIFRSNNGGVNWTLSRGSFAGASAYYTDICVTSTGILYASISSDGAGKGFVRSADKGLTWTDITPVNFKEHDRTVMGINPNNENEVYFFTYMPDSTNSYSTKTSNYSGSVEYISLLKYTYISGKGDSLGGAWVNLSSNLPNNAHVTSGPFDKLNCQGGYDMLVKVQPQTGYVFIGGTNIYVSTDGFTTANNYKQIGGYAKGTTLPYFKIWANHHPDNHDILFYPNSSKVLSVSDGGLRTTDNANTAIDVVWTSINNGYITSQLYTVTLDPTPGSTWLLAGFQDNGNFISTDYTKQQQLWRMPFNGDGAFNYIAPNREFVVMSIQEGRVAKFDLDETGMPKTPTSYSRIDPIGASKDDYTFINPLIGDPNDANILYLPAGKSLWRQSQLKSLPLNGKWDSISTGWFKLTDTIKAAKTNNGFNAQITCIAVSTKPANTVYIGTSVTDVYRIDNANTGNPVFTKINKFGMQGYVSSIAVDPEDDKKVLLCYSNYAANTIWYTENGGTDWKIACGNLRIAANNYSGSTPSMRAVNIVKTDTNGGRKYYLGCSVGLYSTTKLFANASAGLDTTKWLQESVAGIGTSVVNYITHRADDGLVAVSTHGNGAYVNKNKATPLPLPLVDMVSSLYPNPTENGKTVLYLDATKQHTISLAVFDNTGKQCIVYKDMQVQPGKNTIEIPTQVLAMGIYNLIVRNQDNKIIKHRFLVKN